MTLLYFDGFQDPLIMMKPEWDASVAGMTAVAGRDASTNGAFSVVGGAASTTRSKTLTLPTPCATCIVGLAHKTDAFRVVAGHYILGFVRSGTVEAVLVLNASGFLELRRTSGTGTLLGTTSGHTPITLNAWYSIQVKIVLHSSAGSAEVRLNGTTVLTLSGIVTSGVTGDVTALMISSNGNGQLMFYDDLWVCNEVNASGTQGLPNNDFLGDLKVATCYPTSEGDTIQWTPSTGTDNALLVDETPPNTSDYNSTSTAANRDLYQIQDLPATVAAVFGMRVGFYGVKTDAGASSVKPVIKESGGTVTAQATHPLSTTYLPYYGPALYVKPSDSSLFTPSDINGMQVGVELT